MKPCNSNLVFHLDGAQLPINLVSFVVSIKCLTKRLKSSLLSTLKRQILQFWKFKNLEKVLVALEARPSAVNACVHNIPGRSAILQKILIENMIKIITTIIMLTVWK